jgi:hypothetical protein
VKPGLLLLVGWLVAVPAAAQGIIQGRISDKQGGAMPGVTVTVTAPDGSDRTTVTNRDGEYEVSALAPGSYRVAARLTGFYTGQGTTEVASGTAVTLSLSLAVGSIDEPLCLGIDGVLPTANTGPGLRTASGMADAIVYLRIDRVADTVPRPFATDLIGYQQWTRYATTAISGVKGSEHPDGFWDSLGRYRVNDEFVAFLRRRPSTNDFEPFACGIYMVPVKNGRVSWRPSGEPDVDAMKVEDFLATLRASAKKQR